MLLVMRNPAHIMLVVWTSGIRTFLHMLSYSCYCSRQSNIGTSHSSIILPFILCLQFVYLPCYLPCGYPVYVYSYHWKNTWSLLNQMDILPIYSHTIDIVIEVCTNCHVDIILHVYFYLKYCTHYPYAYLHLCIPLHA